jgi:hypothetical protein
VKITIKIEVELNDKGVAVRPAGWNITEAPPGQLQPDLIKAFAAAFVEANSNTGGPPDNQPMLPLDQEWDNVAIPTLPPPPPPVQRSAPAIADLVSVGVTAIVAKQLVAAAGNARCSSLAKWMRDRTDIQNADAVARAVIAKNFSK